MRRRGGTLLAPLLLTAGALLSALALLAGWAQWQLLDSQRWSDTSAEMLHRDAVRKRVAEYVVGEVRASSAGALPAPAGELERRVERELASPRSERVWRTATSGTHRELVRTIEDDGSGVVVLNLRPLIASVARDIGAPMPALPPSGGRVTIVAGDQVGGVRDGTRRLEQAAVVLAILAPLMFALAIAAARGWRVRALAGVGIAVAAAGALVLLTRSLVGANVVDVLAPAAADRDAAAAAWSAGTSVLATMAAIAIAGGLALALAAGVAARPRPRYL